MIGKALFKKTAIEAARMSGLFIKNSVGKVHRISFKGRINIVTDADKTSQAMIIRRIRSSFPEHSILSEECRPQDKKSAYRWVIDPIDGTTNFAHAFPFFCVSIALEEAGKVILGVVYDPVRDEIFVAEKGKGAYLNGRKIHVSNTRFLSHSMLATGFTYGVKGARNKNIRNFSIFLVQAQAVRRAGSAALDMCYVACGRFEGFWEADLKPWDTAAASLIVAEAGGSVTKYNGSGYSHYDNEVLATNSLIHKQMKKILSR
jgi:myo-inositol-1(or 4)-monophosphatase